MADNLKVFGTTYYDVQGQKFTDLDGNEKTYIRPAGTKQIAQNGTADVKKFEFAEVAVPASAVDEGTKQITQNGDGQDVIGYAAVDVNVPGIVPAGTKQINQNGTHDVAQYASAEVNVPNTYSASDEGKVVQSGALVSQSSQTIEENGTYDTTLIDELTVNVSGGGGAWTWKKDGKTHIWLDIKESASLTQYISLRCSANGFNITLDWGDGSAVETKTGSAATQYSHTYTAIGQYEIILDHDGTSSQSGFITGDMSNRACCANIVAIEMSNTKKWYLPECGFCVNLKHVNLGAVWSANNYQFTMCANLEDITANSGVTGALNLGYFQQCPHLTTVDLDFTSIGSSAFQRAVGISVMRIPSTCTSIGTTAFQNNPSLYEIHVERTTPPTLSNTNAFNDIHTGFKIYVPYSADHSVLAAYKAASNWSTYADQIFEEAAS